MTTTEPQQEGEGTPTPQPDTITIPVQQNGNLQQTSGIRNERAGDPPQPFTQEDVERIRQEERARVLAEQTRADQLENELAQFRKAEEERQAAAAKTQRDADRAAKKKAEEEMELRDLIAKKDEEWGQRLEQERQEREKILAVMEQERRHSQLQNYLAHRMTQEADEIAPELRDLVGGNTEQEIDSSIELLKQKSTAILNNYQQMTRGIQAQRPTVGVTSPPVGPDVTSQTSRTYSADDLKALTPEEYAAQREDLLRAAAASRRQ